MARISPRSIWAVLRQWRETHGRDAADRYGYANTWRPAIPPSFLIPLMMLALRQGWSDP